MPRSKHTAAEKLAILTTLTQTGESPKAFARKHGIAASTLYQWQVLYDRDGIAGLGEIRTNQHYSQAFKLAVVTSYMNGEGSQRELMVKFGLRSTSQLRDWINQYNGDKPLTASPFRKQVPEMSRKTTFEERIEVVEYVVKHKHSYAEAAEHFQVSYQQARSWVIKAQNGGYEALTDKRGHRKPATELTELDKLKLENRQLKSQLADKELMEAFVKKFLELQRRG